MRVLNLRAAPPSSRIWTCLEQACRATFSRSGRCSSGSGYLKKENFKSFWRKKFGIDDIIGSRPRAVTRSPILSICKIYILTSQCNIANISVSLILVSDMQNDPITKKDWNYIKILKNFKLWCLIMGHKLWPIIYGVKGKEIRKYTSIASTCGTRDSQSEK